MYKLIAKLPIPVSAWLLGAPAVLAQGSDPTGIGDTKIEEFTIDDLIDLIETIANIVLVLVGIIAVIFLLYGAFLYLTAGGDTEKTQRAKNVIIYSLIAIAVAILAFAIVSFVASIFDA